MGKVIFYIIEFLYLSVYLCIDVVSFINLLTYKSNYY